MVLRTRYLVRDLRRTRFNCTVCGKILVTFLWLQLFVLPVSWGHILTLGGHTVTPDGRVYSVQWFESDVGQRTIWTHYLTSHEKNGALRRGFGGDKGWGDIDFWNAYELSYGSIASDQEGNIYVLFQASQQRALLGLNPADDSGVAVEVVDEETGLPTEDTANRLDIIVIKFDPETGNRLDISEDKPLIKVPIARTALDIYPDSALQIDEAGNIVVAVVKHVRVQSEIYVVIDIRRFTRNGLPDRTFGKNGVLQMPLQHSSGIFAIDCLGKDNILMSGEVLSDDDESHFMGLRVFRDGGRWDVESLAGIAEPLPISVTPPGSEFSKLYMARAIEAGASVFVAHPGEHNIRFYVLDLQSQRRRELGVLDGDFSVKPNAVLQVEGASYTVMGKTPENELARITVEEGHSPSVKVFEPSPCRELLADFFADLE